MQVCYGVQCGTAEDRGSPTMEGSRRPWYLCKSSKEDGRSVPSVFHTLRSGTLTGESSYGSIYNTTTTIVGGGEATALRRRPGTVRTAGPRALRCPPSRRRLPRAPRCPPSRQQRGGDPLAARHPIAPTKRL